MIEYIYIVKCPGCEDEMFNFFTDARMQCDLLMSKKPYITQVEVERNDFGECTDSHDLGTVWSLEDVMKDTEAEPTTSVFTKDDFTDFEGDYNPENDPEFDEMDNSVDCEPETSEVSLEEGHTSAHSLEYEFKPTELQKAKSEVFKLNAMQRFKQDETLPQIFALYKELQPERERIINPQEDFLHFYQRFNTLKNDNEISLIQYDAEKRADITAPRGAVGAVAVKKQDFEQSGTVQPASAANSNLVKFKSNAAKDKLMSESVYKKSERKPIPEGMTIEQLVEEMEENEDTVECTWCEELFDKSECRKEVDLGWLCGRCEAAIKSRGETLTFRENNYWDFLDEEISTDDLTIDDVDPKVKASVADSKFVRIDQEQLMDERIRYAQKTGRCPICGGDLDNMVCVYCENSFRQDGNHGRSQRLIDAALLKSIETLDPTFTTLSLDDKVEYIYNALFLGKSEVGIRKELETGNTIVKNIDRKNAINKFFGNSSYNTRADSVRQQKQQIKQELVQAAKRETENKDALTRVKPEDYINHKAVVKESVEPEEPTKRFDSKGKVEIYYDDLDYTFVTYTDFVTDALVDFVTDEEVERLTNGRFKSGEEMYDYDLAHHYKDKKTYPEDEWSTFLETNVEELFTAHEKEVAAYFKDDAKKAKAAEKDDTWYEFDELEYGDYLYHSQKDEQI